MSTKFHLIPRTILNSDASVGWGGIVQWQYLGSPKFIALHHRFGQTYFTMAVFNGQVPGQSRINPAFLERKRTSRTNRTGQGQKISFSQFLSFCIHLLLALCGSFFNYFVGHTLVRLCMHYSGLGILYSVKVSVCLKYNSRGDSSRPTIPMSTIFYFSNGQVLLHTDGLKPRILTKMFQNFAKARLHSYTYFSDFNIFLT